MLAGSIDCGSVRWMDFPTNISDRNGPICMHSQRIADEEMTAQIEPYARFPQADSAAAS